MGLLGPNKRESYETIAEAVGGQITREESFAKSICLSKTYRGRTLNMTTYTVSTGSSVIIYTYIYVPLELKADLKVNVYPKGVFSDLGKKLGMQDIVVGYGPFDDAFIIKGSPVERVKAFLKTSDLYPIMMAHPKLHFKIESAKSLSWLEPSIDKDEDLLYYSVTQDLRKVEEVLPVFELLERVIDGLIENELIIDENESKRF